MFELLFRFVPSDDATANTYLFSRKVVLKLSLKQNIRPLNRNLKIFFINQPNGLDTSNSNKTKRKDFLLLSLSQIKIANSNNKTTPS